MSHNRYYINIMINYCVLTIIFEICATKIIAIEKGTVVKEDSAVPTIETSSLLCQWKMN
jgi:hypothetical protein